MREILRLERVSKSFGRGYDHSHASHRNSQSLRALTDVSFSLYEKECLGIVGESGSGKTVLMNLIAGFEQADGGSLWVEGGSRIHMVFQNPIESFNPRMRLGASIMEGMRNAGMGRREARERMEKLLTECGLSPDHAARYPHQVSGGECQRAAFARAVACEPQILICDEATSALDVSVQEQLLQLLVRLKEERRMAVLFVCHDMALVQKLCARILVLCDGAVVEAGETMSVIRQPRTEYTRRLIWAASQF